MNTFRTTGTFNLQPSWNLGVFLYYPLLGDLFRIESLEPLIFGLEARLYFFSTQSTYSLIEALGTLEWRFPSWGVGGRIVFQDSDVADENFRSWQLSAFGSYRY